MGFPTGSEVKQALTNANRELHSKAHLHDLSNVLDFGYLPATVEENELFELQKRFMYSIFLSKITVADGAHIVKSIPDA